MGPFVKRKEIWIPTWRGWLAGLLGGGILAVTVILLVPPFLSPNQPRQAPVLVVEGWVSEPTLERGIALSQQANYKLVIVTGSEIGKGTYFSHYGTYANLGAERMKEMGFKGTNIVAVPCPKVDKDRTYHSAVALRKYLVENTPYREADIVTTGVHGRRTWLLFSIAGKPEIKFGIISDNDPGFDVRRWWRTSYGVRAFVDELVGYLYAKIVFQPE